MPGPVSDSYDPEWGTREVAGNIDKALKYMYRKVSKTLGGSRPIYIRDLVEMHDELNEPITETLTEWEWRMLRFALERAQESI